SVISGFIPPNSGQVELKGQSTQHLRPDQVAARGMVRTFQVPREFGDMTVLDNLRVAGSSARADTIFSGMLGGREAREAEAQLKIKAERMLERLNLVAVAHNAASALS